MCPVGLNTPSDVGNFSFVSLLTFVLPKWAFMELCVSVTSMLFLKFRLLFVAVLHFVAAHGTRISLSVIL